MFPDPTTVWGGYQGVAHVARVLRLRPGFVREILAAYYARSAETGDGDPTSHLEFLVEKFRAPDEDAILAIFGAIINLRRRCRCPPKDRDFLPRKPQRAVEK